MAVDYGRPGWLVVPAAHACLLPLAQTTAELLADWMAAKVWSVLREEGGSALTRLLLELEESAGQSARTELRA